MMWTQWFDGLLVAAFGCYVGLSSYRRLIGSWIWQNLKKDVVKVEGTPCVAESGATGN